jgi:hypothetical protein
VVCVLNCLSFQCSRLHCVVVCHLTHVCVFLCSDIRRNKAHTLWLDNFSKIRALQFPDLELGTWQDCNWTGMAMRVSRVDVDMNLRLNEAKEIEPAMPHHVYKIYPTMKHAFMVLNPSTPKCPKLHTKSLTTLLGVKNVPLKPSHETLNKPEHRAAVHEGHDSLDTCFPEGIVAINIGSNKGLLQLMRNHYESVCVANAGKRYSCLNVDANIFDRILKVTTFTHTRLVHTTLKLSSELKKNLTRIWLLQF